MLMLTPCALVSGLAGAQPLAPTLAACPGGALAQASCQRSRLVASACEGVPAEARGHCVRCVVANNRLDCDTLPPEAAAQCRSHEARLARCTEGPAEEAEACLQRLDVGLATPSAAHAAVAGASASAPVNAIAGTVPGSPSSLTTGRSGTAALATVPVTRSLP